MRPATLEEEIGQHLATSVAEVAGAWAAATERAGGALAALRAAESDYLAAVAAEATAWKGMEMARSQPQPPASTPPGPCPCGCGVAADCPRTDCFSLPVTEGTIALIGGRRMRMRALQFHVAADGTRTPVVQFRRCEFREGDTPATIKIDFPMRPQET